jgi:hypothetical protein
LRGALKRRLLLMSLSDAELFDFNAALLEDYDDGKAHADLEK